MKLTVLSAIAAFVLTLTGIGSVQAGVMGGGGTVLTLTPSQATLSIGATVQLTATLTNPGGNPVKGKSPVSWTSSNVNFATVSPTGLVTAVGAGSATITAMSAGSSGTATIVVANPPAQVFVFVLNEADNTPIVGATVSLTYSGNPIAVVGTTDIHGTVYFEDQPINIACTITATLNDGSGETVVATSTGWAPNVNNFVVWVP